ncbi:MAG: hypothetical protein WCO35_00355 [Candidatus Nomurabacteria bacterium]
MEEEIKTEEVIETPTEATEVEAPVEVTEEVEEVKDAEVVA